jgi:hypothetical protein
VKSVIAEICPQFIGGKKNENKRSGEFCLEELRVKNGITACVKI